MEPTKEVLIISTTGDNELDTNTEMNAGRRVLTTPIGEGPSGVLGSHQTMFHGSDDNYEEGVTRKPSSPVIKSKLNPDAKEWDPNTYRAPEEDRCCFLTFSNGFPLTERQIIKFFNQKFGPACVEKVYIHKPLPRDHEQPQPQSELQSESHPDELQLQPPLFGKIVFRSILTVALVLRGDEQVRYRIDRRQLWCKKFDKDKIRRPLTHDKF